jgi:hypothetical protein
MISASLKVAGYVMLAAVLAAGGGYAWARKVHMPRIVEIGSTACGVPESSPSFGMPLEAVMRVAGGRAFGLGPVDIPAGGGPVRLRFEPTLDGEGGEVRLAGTILYLPTSFGQERQLPRRITLHCRDGAIGSVRYQGKGGASMVFQVARGAARAPASAPGETTRLPDLY